MKKRYSLILAFLMMLGVSACSTGSKDKDSTGISSSSSLVQSSSQVSTNSSTSTNVSSSQISTSSSTTSSSSSSSSTSKKVMEHVNFPDNEVVYDGQGHTLEASVYPDGSTVTYLDNGPFVDVGTYVIKVRISHPDYEDYEDTATLVIKAATMSTISFKDETITFDGNEHTLLATGYPEDAVVTYVDAGPFINVGEYEITVRIELANYEPYEETKKLVIEAADMDEDAISFEDLTVAYTGDPYTIEATGYPEDATITYTNAGPYTDVGEYEIGLKIEKENYNPITTTATLKIEKGTMAPFTFDDLTVEYDGEPHTIEATGFPEGSLVTYSNEGPYTEIGEYEIQVTVSHKNFETVTETAKLNIVKPAEKLHHLKYQAFNKSDTNNFFQDMRGSIYFDDETYSTGMIYVSSYYFNFTSVINGENISFTAYYDESTIGFVFTGQINTEGFKILSAETIYSKSKVNYVVNKLTTYLPQFSKYYGPIIADYSDSIDGEVYAPASHKEMYYDNVSWSEVNGHAIGKTHIYTNKKGENITYQGIEVTTPANRHIYRYYHYLDEKEVNLGDTLYHYFLLNYVAINAIEIPLNIVAFDKNGVETMFYKAATNQYGDISVSSPIYSEALKDMPCTAGADGIASNIAGFYIEIGSFNNSSVSSLLILKAGFGASQSEFY